MKMSRLGALCLGAVWFAACATAQDGGPPNTANGGSSGSFSGGGTPGAAGTSAFGGTGAVPGAGGTTGAAGSIGTAGTGGLSSGGASGSGAGGAAGTGGTGGGAPVFDTGVCAVSPTMSLSYETTSTASQIGARYQFINTSDTPIPVAQLKIRYFFTNEKPSGWAPNIYDTRLGGGMGGDRDIKAGAALTVVKLAAPLVGADSYAELTYTSTATLEKTATGSVDWSLQPNSNNPPDQIQSDDYSYNAAYTAFTVWDHVAIYQDNTLVWGCVPKAPGGETGAAGDTGAGGDTGAAGAP